MNNENKKWNRVSFQANYADSRPITFPPPGPFWETGFAADLSYATIIAYFPCGEEHRLKEFWPEAAEIDWHRIDDYPVFTARFEEPKWWKEQKTNCKIIKDKKMKCKIYFNSSDFGSIIEMKNITFKEFYNIIKAEKSGLVLIECKNSTIYNINNISCIEEITEC